jgi:AAA domain/Bifunctional DNA primase/polymerase, N-terminal/Primase C terminal 1 (PriCT-1)
MNVELSTSAVTRGGRTRRAVGTANTVATVDSALRLARQGVAIFPCGKDKKPLTQHGFKDATTDETQIRRWWMRYPDALVGVPTGSTTRLVVIDVDPAGLDFILDEEYGALLEAGRRHNTRRGFHYLFQLPDGALIRSSAGKIAKGVDVRAEGGYIIWWPAAGLKSFGPELGKLPLLPNVLRELLNKNASRNAESMPAPTLETTNDTDGIPEGKRNDFLASEAGKLRRVNSDPVVISEAVHALNRRRCSPPLESKEVDQIVQSILRYPAHDSAPDTKARSFTVIPDHQFVEREPLSWHVKGVLPKAELIVLYGPSGSGKSFLAFDMVAAIATGASWQDRKTTKGRVVYVVAEGATGFLNRLKAFSKTHDANLPGVRIVAEAPNLLGEHDYVSLAQEIETSGGADLIVIDTLAACSPGADENAAKDMGRVIEHCKQLHNATGATVLLVHHSGKDEAKGARGWSGLRAAADAEIEVSKNGDQRVATVTKMKDGEDGMKFAFKLLPIELGVDADQEPVTSCVVEPAAVVTSGNRTEPRPGTVERTLFDAIRDDPSADGASSVSALIDAALPLMPQPSGRDTRRQHLMRALRTLAAKGFVTVEGDTCRLS